MDPRVEQLLKLPQFEQRSPEWFQQRNNAITASDIPTVLSENNYKTPWSLLLDKCNSNPKPFVGNEATRWGTHYEDIAIEKYSSLRNKKVLSFGLIIHPEHSWLGGSPDGITTDGILLEVKCPLRRKIVHGEVPHHYLSQVLLNLEICNLDIAHFIEFVPGNSDNDYEINIVEIKRDHDWFKRKMPVMKEFWDSVVYYRKNGIENHPKYKTYKERSDNRKKESVDNGIILDIRKNSPLFINDEEDGN
jgi:putative phage-type endonuclease